MRPTEIILDIENSLRNDMTFGYVLKKNPNLFIHKLKSVEFKDYWFEYKKNGIVFLGDPIINETTSRGNPFYVYISDFSFTGALCYSDKSYKNHKIDITLNATIRVFKRINFEIDITDKTNNVEVWDLNQKIIYLLSNEANKNLDGLDLIPYDYEIYTQTWSKIDTTLINSRRQSHVTSRYYLQELVECYERIKHLLSIVLLCEPYSNNYTSIKTNLSANSEFQHVFPINRNFKIYDKLYLSYSELTIESYYKFWERVGFYLFQFLKPTSRKINDKNLSLYKLIFELNKEYSINPDLQNYHFDWFVDFVLNTNSDHEKLLNFRHPLVHYKVDDSTGQGVGSLISTVLNNWTKNMTSEKDLKDLENNNKVIKEFLLAQFEKCKIGYEHMIGIITLLPDKKKV